MFRSFDHIQGREIAWLGKRILNEISSPDVLTPVILESMANELLVYAARSLDRSKNVPDWLRQAVEMINDCCTEQISVAKIASSIGVHPLHLARAFRRFFDLSPGEFSRNRRIKFASNLLLSSKQSLAQIALISGFSNQSQFTTCYKKITGITPGKFRDLHNS